MAKIFYVEDDANLSFVVKDCLKIAGHEVHHYDKGDEALKGFNSQVFDICLLDVMLPNLDGLSIARAIRAKNYQIPIIFVSAKVQIDDKLTALNLGADDYLFKPFSIEELLLKVNIFIKRKQSQVEETHPKEMAFGRFSLNCEELLLLGNDAAIRLTRRECDLLVYFLKNQNKLLKREEILVALWGQDDYFLGRSLDVFISRLRKYLSSDPNLSIENIPRVGFKLAVTG
jgi:two-component system, OmpR family, response regulator VicR